MGVRKCSIDTKPELCNAAFLDATKPLKCSLSKLGCALSIIYAGDFQDLEKKKMSIIWIDDI